MSKTNIEWADRTWNPIIGCSHISEGCDNCYAEKMACRLATINATTDNYANVVKLSYNINVDKFMPSGWNAKTHFVKSAIDKPRHWKKPQRIFVCSMGDLFHESVPVEWIENVMEVITDCPQHTFIVLTKRPERMKAWFDNSYITPNLWLGVTVENQEQADKRLPILVSIPNGKKFISIEPMLDEINLNKYYFPYRLIKNVPVDSRTKYIDLLDWVILGGETGTQARPMHPRWVIDIRDQCKKSNTPFFFKGWGEWRPLHELYCNMDKYKNKLWFNHDPEHSSCKIGKKASGRKIFDSDVMKEVEYLEFPNS